MEKLRVIILLFALYACTPEEHLADIKLTYFDGSTEELEVKYHWNSLDRIEQLKCGCTVITRPSRCNVKKVEFKGHTTGWIQP